MNKTILGDLLSEVLEAKRISLDKLSALTSIPKRYLEAIKENDAGSLPPSPYVRSYLLKIAAVLDEDPGNLLEAYESLELKQSGRDDALPTNRFAFKPAAKKWLWFLPLVLFVVFLAFWLNNFLGVPEIEINLAETTIVSSGPIISIEGRINPRDSLFINNENVFIDKDGRFAKEAILERGQNAFEIKAKRFLGRETKIIRHVFYEEGER
jgi:transcriptional regulator with XRE-family HTH domain